MGQKLLCSWLVIQGVWEETAWLPQFKMVNPLEVVSLEI